MSVIATDGRVVCSDGMGCLGGVIIATARDKIIEKNGVVYASAGPSGMLKDLIAWVEAGAHAKDAPQTEDGWDLLAMGAEGVYLASQNTPYLTRVETPIAIGSGMDLALGAMLAGASPQDAVRIACLKDTGCGGKIQVVRLKEPEIIEIVEAAE